MGETIWGLPVVEEPTLLEHGRSLLDGGWPRIPDVLPNGARIGWALPDTRVTTARTELTLVYRTRRAVASLGIHAEFLRDIDEDGFKWTVAELERECARYEAQMPKQEGG